MTLLLEQLPNCILVDGPSFLARTFGRSNLCEYVETFYFGAIITEHWHKLWLNYPESKLFEIKRTKLPKKKKIYGGYLANPFHIMSREMYAFNQTFICARQKLDKKNRKYNMKGISTQVVVRKEPLHFSTAVCKNKCNGWRLQSLQFRLTKKYTMLLLWTRQLPSRMRSWQKMSRGTTKGKILLFMSPGSFS